MAIYLAKKTLFAIFRKFFSSIIVSLVMVSGTHFFSFRQPTSLKTLKTQTFPDNRLFPSTKILKNQSERKAFCNLVKLQAVYRHLQEPSIWNLCFLFESYDPSKEHLDSNGGLTGLGKLSANRWSKAVQSVHLVFPSKHQAYNVRHARHPHYQCMFDVFLEFISKPLQGDFELVICWPNEDHDTDEISVRNGSLAAKFTCQVDWPLVEHRIHNDSRVVRSSGGAERQSPGNSVDYGFTTSQATSRKNSESGHSQPVRKKNSDLAEIISAFVTLSDLAKDFRPRWRNEGSPFEYMEESIRCQFSQTIHPDNYLESLHPAVTTIDKQCGCHNDNNVNSNILSDVYCLSIVLGDRRVSINAQQRKSIDDYNLRTTDQGELLFTLEKIYESIPHDRRFIGGKLHDGEQIVYVPRFPSIRNPCNLDPLSYSLPVVESCCRLAVRFKLNALELMSLQLAAQCLPNTTLFHSVACRILLELPTNRIPSDFRKGFGFGYYTMRIMMDEFHYYRDSGRAQTFLRYNNYRQPPIPTRQQWEDKCALTFWYCLHVFSVYGKLTSAKQRAANYAVICNRLSEMWEGCGILAVTHSILQKCLLGLLPLWCLDLAVIGSENKSIKFFNEEFSSERKLKGAEVDRFVCTVSKRFEQKYRIPFSVRILENFFCKAFRELTRLLTVSGNMRQAVELIGQTNGRAEVHQKFCDLHVPGQLIFKSSRLGLIVIFPNGSSKTLESGAIFERIPFGNDLLKVEEMAKEMRLATTEIPSDTRMTGFILDKKLIHPMQNFQVDFPIPPLPPLDATGNRRARTALGRYVTGVNPITPMNTDRNRRVAV